MEEIWKDIKGYEGLYQVSNNGSVRSLNRLVKHSGTFERVAPGRIIKQHQDINGYMYVGLHSLGKSKQHKVHRLVAVAFIENKDNKPEINHLDENKKNNHKENLAWSTRTENEKWGTKHQRCVKHTDYNAIKEKNSKSVCQISQTGEMIKTWNSLAEIHRELGYSAGDISMCCNGKYTKPLYGCFWKYKAVV